jgi:hypothetical protein
MHRWLFLLEYVSNLCLTSARQGCNVQLLRRLLQYIYQPSWNNAYPSLAAQWASKLKPVEETFTVSFSLLEVPETEHFVARQEELTEIHETLSDDGSGRTVVLHGLGGIGKTQLAVAYAKRHKTDYSAIFWLNSKDEDSLKQSFVKMAKRILKEYPSQSWLSAIYQGSNLNEIADAVKRWLDHPKSTRWLIVCDNYDNPKLRGNTDLTAVDLCRFLPETDHGSIIVTTRSSQVKLGHCIRVGKLKDIRDSLEILSHTSGRGNVADSEICSQ